MRFRKKPVEVEAVRFTGDNWDEMHAHCGHRALDGQIEVSGGQAYADVFNPIGTYLLGHLQPRGVTAELWVAANGAHLGITPGEWIIRDQYGLYPCKDDGTGQAPLNYEPVEESS